MYNSFTKLLVASAVILIVMINPVKAQQIGATYSYFLPTKGYFSMPVSPFSFSDLGLKFGDNFSLVTGISLYRFSGMHVSKFPFEVDKPAMGPFFSLLIPLSAKFILSIEKIKFELKAGMFGFYNFDNHIIYTSLNEPAAEYKGWDIASLNLDYNNKPGYGLTAGAAITYFFKKNLGIVLGMNYYDGAAPLNFKGTLSGGDIGASLQSENVSYPDAELDFSGFELKVGVDYSM